MILHSPHKSHQEKKMTDEDLYLLHSHNFSLNLYFKLLVVAWDLECQTGMSLPTLLSSLMRISAPLMKTQLILKRTLDLEKHPDFLLPQQWSIARNKRRNKHSFDSKASQNVHTEPVRNCSVLPWHYSTASTIMHMTKKENMQRHRNLKKKKVSHC